MILIRVKKKLRNILLTLIGLLLTLTQCAPQHQYAFQQFEARQDGFIFSIQGYVANSPEVSKSLEEKWNILAIEMSKKSGFIEGYLSQGVGDSKLILAHSKWRSLESLRNAFADTRILELEKELPKKQFEHLFVYSSLGGHLKKN